MTISTSWKRTLPANLLALALALPFPAGADSAAEARRVVEETSSEVLALLANKALPNDERIRQLIEVAERRFDLPLMGNLILGRTRHKLSRAQQDEFLEEFKRYLVVTYGDSLVKYSNEKVQIAQARTERNGDVTVRTRIVGGNADGVLVDYRLRSRSSPWRVIDVIIENVSVVQNYRSQVQEIVNRHGAEQLITILRQKNDRKERISS